MKELDVQIEKESFWTDKIEAQKVMKERNSLEKKITDFESLKLEIDEIINLIELAREETDQDILVEGQNKLKEFESLIKKKELELLLSGEADQNDAFLEINAGAGGTESQDWAKMLLRMYSRW